MTDFVKELNELPKRYNYGNRSPYIRKILDEFVSSKATCMEILKDWDGKAIDRNNCKRIYAHIYFLVTHEYEGIYVAMRSTHIYIVKEGY